MRVMRSWQLWTWCFVTVFLSATAVSDRYLFEVHVGDWDTCKLINSSRACYRTREVRCQTIDGSPVPWRYCTERGMGKLATVEECECVQDCAVSQWSEWSSCGSGEVYSTRERDLVVPALRGGNPCPPLQETRRCEGSFATIDQLFRQHTWKIGRWGECLPQGLDGKTCGLGLRNRTVDCVNMQGTVVNQTFCLEEEAYQHVLPPHTTQLCEIPCPCILHKGGWSECEVNCNASFPSGVQRRTNIIIQYPTLGERCGALEEVRSCSINCPMTAWTTSEWLKCTMDTGAGLCGVGLRKRYVYCIEHGSDGTTKPVNSERCDPTQKPSSLASCEVPCDIDCIVSEWNGWSHCPTDTCEQMYANRTRIVLVPPSGTGAACPHLQEFRACPPLPCFRYITDDFSACYPETCGSGTQSRTVACIDIGSEEAQPDSSPCSGIPRPENFRNCYTPCANDCVVSEWEEWSECSEPCGNIAGIQQRSRHLLANGTGFCDYNLYEERDCLVDTPCTSEAVYHILYSDWSVCHWSNDDITEGAGMQDDDQRVCEGIQTQTAQCVKDGRVINASDCPINFDSNLQRPCSTFCRNGCIMSEWLTWSECSGSCGREHQTNVRRLIQYGDDCPNVNDDGFEFQTVECSQTACNTSRYSWRNDSWSRCNVLPTPLSQLSEDYSNSLIPDPGARCGSGYRTRNVHCVDDGGNDVEDWRCPAETRLLSFEPCIEECYHRCIVTEWTDHSVCSSSGIMERSREIIPSKGSDDYLRNCPELQSVLQLDIQNCPDHNFDQYVSLLYMFGVCYLLDSVATCGVGKEYDLSVCMDISKDPRTVSSQELCNPDDLDFTHCREDCPVDCQLSEWSSWSECSVSCGQGYWTRTRRIMTPPSDGGRECGSLNETTTCQQPACDYAAYSLTPLSQCTVINESMTCGEGRQFRYPVCTINGVVEPNISACAALGSAAPRERPCTVPCDGDCVMGEWGEWGPSSSRCEQRTRNILRQGSGCGESIQTRDCSTSNPYWLTHPWTHCIVQWNGHPSQDYCGNGIQRRIVECFDDGRATYDAQCDPATKPRTSRGCFIPCPVDCEVSFFGAWSGCGECTLNISAVRRKERRELVTPANGGRACPPLVKEELCLNVGCDEYFVEKNFLDCASETSEKVCGLHPHSALLCRKNRDYVPLDECIEANFTGKIIHNASLLLTSQQSYCDVPCPVSVFSDWGEWSECLYMCEWPLSDRNEVRYMFQFRSRSRLNSWNHLHSERHIDQEIRQCTPIDLGSGDDDTTDPPSEQPPQKCLRFDWSTSEWREDDTRDVWCQSDDTIVDGKACIASLKPVARRGKEGCDCPPQSECDGTYNTCNCVANFEKVGSLCLPIEGCVSDLHCPLPGHGCRNGTCVCVDDSDPDRCLTDVTEEPSDGTTSSTNTTDESTEESEQTDLPMDILVIVLISCVPLLIFIVIILLLVIITYKCRQSLEKKHKCRTPPTILHQNERLNNQPERTESRLKNGGVRVEEVPMPTNPLPLHLHHSSTSSGFVDEMEHEFKYGQGDNGYSQTQSDDVDEHCFPPESNPYTSYPLHDYPSTPHTPITPHSPYPPAAVYGVEEPDAVPYPNDMRMGQEPMRIPPHLIPRSLSEEAHLARMSGVSGPYDRLTEGVQYPEDYPEHLHRGHPHYLHSPPHSQPHPYPHNAPPHHPHPHHPHHHHHHYHHSHGQGAGGRDNRIMVGMENALVRAIEEVDSGSRSPSLGSSLGSRNSSMRRSGRRRHHRTHQTGSGRVHGGHRVGSPVGAGPGYHGYYMAYREDEPYQSNTLPRTSTKQGSPAIAHRSPQHHVPGASPLVHNVAASNGHYVRSASNELLEMRRDRPYITRLETSRNVPGPSVPMEMPHALPDEDPLTTFQSGNPQRFSPPISASQVSEDYDHINSDLSQGGVPPPPPPPAPESTPAVNSTPLRPPLSSTNRSSPPSSNPPPDSASLFPQELFKAIQKRANSIDNQAPDCASQEANGSLSKGPPAPPLRTVSDPKGNPPPPPVRSTPLTTSNGKGNAPPPPTRYTPVTATSSNSKGSPPAPPIRHTPVTMTSSNSKGSPPAPPTRVGSIRGPSTNQQGAPPPPPPPPPPPIRH